MVRISKQEERRNKSPRKHRNPSKKTGSLKDNLPVGFKEHTNAIEGDMASKFFVGKVK